MKNIKKVTVAGSGILGSQIAYQSAYKNKHVIIYDVNQDALSKAKKRVNSLWKPYHDDLQVTKEQFNNGLNNINYTDDLSRAVVDADLVIEAIPENSDIKHKFYKNLAKVAPKKTFFTSNSSTMVASMFMQDTGRPEKFLNLHFSNQVWKNNITEIMGSSKTNLETLESIISFSREIGMIPIKLNKEQPGYILNSLLLPFLDSALKLWANDVTTPKIIDKTWMKATGATQGPFAIMDIIGLRTAYNATSSIAQQSQDKLLKKGVSKLKKLVDSGRLGRESGIGFYRYPDPEYKQHNFLER